MGIEPMFRDRIKRLSHPLGLDGFLRDAYVKSGLIAEKAYFMLAGRPQPETSILLAGSGRSGTTWLSNLLAAMPSTQLIFEPLWPTNNPAIRKLTGWNDGEPRVRGYYLTPDKEHPEWDPLLQAVFSGRCRNYWTDKYRFTLTPKRFLIKEIRANMMMGYIYRKLRPRIVYLVRHPCSVIVSRLTMPVPWAASVQDLLRQEELVEDHLRPWLKEIEREKSLVGAHAVWWAVENRIAQGQLAAVPHIRVFFEELAASPDLIKTQIYAHFNSQPPPDKFERVFSSPSGLSHRPYRDVSERLSLWKGFLSQDDQRAILTWARRFGVDWYTEDIMPSRTPYSPKAGGDLRQRLRVPHHR